MAKRVHTHLLIDDTYSAVVEARKGLQQFPESEALRIALIKALCLSGKEIEALHEWKEAIKVDEALLTDRTALETLAWGVLRKGGSSNQLVIRLNSLIGAAMTRDAKAIPLIRAALRGSNSLLRAVAVGLAAAYGDLPLQEEIARLLREEKVWSVRLELIKAAGQLRMKEVKARLIEIIGDPRTLAEEKVAAIIAIVSMYEEVDDRELIRLIESPRAGLRELACQIILHLDLTGKADLLFPLLRDPHSGVRVSTLNTLALLGIKGIKGKPILEAISPLLDDHKLEVAVTANWLALLQDDKQAISRLKKWVLKGKKQEARLASAAVAISGHHGVSLAKKLMRKSKDPYVRVNLAMGLIGQREQVVQACQCIDQRIQSKERCMWDSDGNPLFKTLAPSRVPHHPQIPNYPLVVDQMTRLELLQVLCMMEYPGSEEAVKKLLLTKSWGTVGAAAATLLHEGEEDALEVVRTLLNDPDEKVRIQAGLVLAFLGGDKEAVRVLQKAYPAADKQVKIHILEAVAKVGDKESIAFLIDRLHEPYQVLRVVAATAIIRSIYH